MPRKNFIRQIENFTCEHCGKQVAGSGYTNHCPNCLWSKHIDNIPGDRSNPCGGMMEPIGLELHGDQRQIIHCCQACGAVKKNQVAANDNSTALSQLPVS